MLMGRILKLRLCIDFNSGVSQRHTLHTHVPPAALIGRVDPEDVQLLLAAVLLDVQAEEVLPVLVQVVDQVAVEAVLSDDVDGACGEIRRAGSASVCRLILSAAG